MLSLLPFYLELELHFGNCSLLRVNLLQNKLLSAIKRFCFMCWKLGQGHRVQQA